MQGGRWLRACPHVGLRRIVPSSEEPAGAAPSESIEGADPRVQELKDRLEQELQLQGEEQHRCILKRKEQHVAEVPGRGQSTILLNPPSLHRERLLTKPYLPSLQQIAKMIELAKEKQASELKTFKETSEMYDCLPATLSLPPSKGSTKQNIFLIIPVFLQ
jgi:phosphatidylinositol phospholipase C beta